MIRYDNGNVVWDAMDLEIPEYKSLMDNDKSKDKHLFNEAISLIYFVNHPKSPWINKFPTDRKKLVCLNKFGKPELYYLEIEKLPGYLNAERYFREDQYTKEQLLFQMWEKDAEDYIQYLKNVPFLKKGTAVIDGVKQTVDVDNGTEKMKAMQHLATLLDIADKYRKRIKEETKTKAVGNKEKKIFED